MFINLHTKTRVLLNIILAQIGFATISIIAILSEDKIAAIIVVNIVFAVIIAYIHYKSMQRVLGGINRVKEFIEDLMNFVFFKSNHIRKAEYIKNDDFGSILKDLNSYFDDYSKMRKDDMHVLGEMVIALDKVSQGIYSTQIYSDTNNFMVHTLKNILNNMLKTANTNMKDLADIISLYAKQDYRKSITINPILKGEMKLAMEQINQLGIELSNNAKLNLTNGNLLEKNSLIMNKSVENLASKSNVQAASLEETAAALEEITSLTKNNTSNAFKMADLSKDVKDSVVVGADLSNQTAISMDEINSKVEAINEAIDVIDQIAFQTNILSLNAAVEAATAGEAGKGFAVVAGEVRNLASRSVEAAREIKDLVENATSKTNEGKKISDDMRDGYNNLNRLISETINIIQDVSQASSEQLKGIEQINDAISMLDKATQENALETNNVATIANETLKMAQLLLEDAKAKKID